jgi:hypothetical protein
MCRAVSLTSHERVEHAVCYAAALIHVITRAEVVPRASQDVISTVLRRETAAEGEQPFWLALHDGPHGSYDVTCTRRLQLAALDAAPRSAPTLPTCASVPAAMRVPGAAASMTVLLRNETGYALSLLESGVSPSSDDKRWLQLPPVIGARSTAAVQLRSAQNAYLAGSDWLRMRPLWLYADGTVPYKVDLPEAAGTSHHVTLTLKWTVGRLSARAWTLSSPLTVLPTWEFTPPALFPPRPVTDVFRTEVQTVGRVCCAVRSRKREYGVRCAECRLGEHLARVGADGDGCVARCAASLICPSVVEGIGRHRNGVVVEVAYNLLQSKLCRQQHATSNRATL